MAEVNLNGGGVARVEKTIFIALPREAWRSCGPCSCKYCGGGEGFWDTLAVSSEKPKDGADYAWTVHRPGPR